MRIGKLVKDKVFLGLGLSPNPEPYITPYKIIPITA